MWYYYCIRWEVSISRAFCFKRERNVIMLKKYIKTLAMALIMALVFTMFVPVEKTEASSEYGLTQPAIYTNKIVLNLKPSAMPSGTISKIHLDVRANNGNYRRINTFPGNTSQITITGVNPANEYDIEVSCDYTDSYGSKHTDRSIGWIYDAAMAPVKLTGLKQRDCLESVQGRKAVGYLFERAFHCKDGLPITWLQWLM